MTDENSAAFKAGFSAADGGYEKIRNPFPVGSEERENWDAGWEAYWYN